MMMTNNYDSKDSIYTVKEIAQILRISERSAYNFINKTTDFKVLRIGRCIRVYKDTFDRWLQGVTVQEGR